MSAAVMLALMVACAIGVALARAIWPNVGAPVALPLAAALGLAVTSVPGLTPPADIALLIFLTLIAWRRSQPRAAAAPTSAPGVAGQQDGSLRRVGVKESGVARAPAQGGADTRSSAGWRWGALLGGVIFAQMALLALVASARAGRAEPLGSWDGWAIWNMHARFFARAPGAWAGLLRQPAIAWTHPDYPWIVPGAVAHAWRWAGAEPAWAAAAVSMLFAAATVGLLVAGAARFAGAAAGFVAGCVLLGTPAFVLVGSNEHADIPLGLYLLASCVLLVDALGDPAARAESMPAFAGRSSRSSGPRGSGNLGAAALSGVCAGLACGVKNEGWLVLAAVWGIVVILAIVGRLTGSISLSFRAFGRVYGAEIMAPASANRTRRSYGAAIAFFVSAAIAAAPALWFKLRVAPPNDLASSHPAGRLGALLDLRRHETIWAALRRDLVAFGQWHWGAWLPALAVVGAVSALILRRRWLDAAEAAVGAILLLVALGYYAVYLLTPYDLQWHLDTSLVRLLLQLWPTAIFFGALLCRRAPAAAAPSTPARRVGRAAVLTLNVALAAVVLWACARQRGPDEMTARQGWSGRAAVVLGPGWFGLETNSRHRWAWSQGNASLQIRRSDPGVVALSFALRSLAPRRVTIVAGHDVLWDETVGLIPQRVRLNGIMAEEVRFETDSPGTLEANRPDARRLAIALYDPVLEVP